MDRKRKIRQYIREYQWANIFAMLRNNRKDPQICTERIRDKLVVITGATSGIGRITAIKFASMGAHLLCINRNEEKSKALKEEIESKFKVNCHYILADLSILTEIKVAAKKLSELSSPIDILIHNAGVFLTRKEITPDGIEKVFAVHYLSSFIINYTLIEKLRTQETARIILVSSEGHRFAVWGLRLDDLNWEKRRYSGLKSYGSAKTAQLLSMLIFAEKFKNSNVRINAIHPGAVKTDTGQDNGRWYKWYKRNFLNRFLKSADISAEAIYYLGVSKEVEHENAKFFNLTCREEPAPPALDREIAIPLWEKSLEMSGLEEKPFDPSHNA